MIGKPLEEPAESHDLKAMEVLQPERGFHLSTRPNIIEKIDPKSKHKHAIVCTEGATEG